MLTIRLPDEIETRLNQLVEATGYTKTFYVRTAVLEHMDYFEKKYLGKSKSNRLVMELNSPPNEDMARHKLANDLYKLYLALFDTEFSTYYKQRSLEAAATQLQDWKITGISKDALEELVKNGTNNGAAKGAKGLRRAHHKERSQRAKEIFERDTPLSHDEFFKKFYDEDVVTLVTAAENAHPGMDRWSRPIIAVPPGHLKTGSYSIQPNQNDIKWAKAALAELNNRPAAGVQP